MDTTDSVKSFKNLKNDPVAILTFISKCAKVNLIQNNVICGHIYSIDPITLSVILLLHNDVDKEPVQTVLVLGHAIVEINVQECKFQMKLPLDNSLLLNSAKTKQKKVKLLQWFKSNLLTVSESDDNIIFGNVTILPPYNTTDICTDNAIVAMQVKKIMEEMPEDFDMVTCDELKTKEDT